MNCFKLENINESCVLISYNISEYTSNYPQQMRRFLLSRGFTNWHHGLDTFFKKIISSKEELDTLKNELCERIKFIEDHYLCKISLSIFIVNGKELYYQTK